MYLILLISGIVFIPQALSLQCNKAMCYVDEACPGKATQCEAELTRCGTIRHSTYDVNTTIVTDVLFRGCIKADTCKDASYHFGANQHFYTTRCCDSDLCNSEVPPPPTRKPYPNGSKCYLCAGDPNCNVTMDCTGDETLCFIDTKGPKTVHKGCATKSFCVDPPSIIESHKLFMKCCDGDLCNRSSSTTTTVCIQLLATMLISLFFFSK